MSSYIFSLGDLIGRAARSHPNKIAYKYLNQALTYQDLDRKTNQLAHHLLDNGLKKGDRVGIFLPRSIETPIAVHAILKSGGVFVPIDTKMPQSRLAFILKDCQVKFIISTNTFASKLTPLLENPDFQISTIGMNSEEFKENAKNITWDEVFKSDNTVAINISIVEQDLAYIMYTSGTTGTPKGIMHTHRSGLSYAQLSQQQYNVQPEDIIANHSPLHFDISTFGYLTSPLSCATTVIISEAHTKFPMSLAQLIQKEKISIWYSVPVALMQLTNLPTFEGMGIDSVRWVLFGGETCPAPQLIKLMACWPQAQYSNVYGPAEVNQCTYYTIPKDLNPEDSVPLGKIWPNTEMLILDDDDQPVAEGEIGKLVIHSATMMYGYWNNEELTEKGFYIASDSAAKNFKKKYYRTGDLVSLHSDGNMRFFGRGDRQVKTRGYRVELDAVESLIRGMEGVANAAVIAYSHRELGTLIGASVELKQNQILVAKDIQDELATKLPKYCVPEKIKMVDTISRTSAGKIDYKSIKASYDEMIE